MKSKKAGRGTPKKQQDKKSDINPLTAFLMAKHSQPQEQPDRASQTALLLETVLTGSDEQLRQVLEQWSDQEAIGQVVRAWGSGHSILFFQRLTLLIEEECRWAFPWVSQLLKLRIEWNAPDLERLQKYTAKQGASNLSQVLKFQGKLMMFEA